MYRKILCPVDGSDASLRGLEHALALAKDQSARVRILNVIDELVIADLRCGSPLICRSPDLPVNQLSLSLGISS